MKQQVVDRQRKYKQSAVDYKGGCCTICGFNLYIGALEFHHIDPSKKDFEVSSFYKKPLVDEKVRAELDKCVLLCSNCHRMYHAGLINLN